jgi:hypothetical protein
MSSFQNPIPLSHDIGEMEQTGHGIAVGLFLLKALAAKTIST